MDTSDVQILEDLEVQILPDVLDQNISVDIVEGGGAVTEEEWTMLLAAQAEDEGAVQEICPKIKLNYLVNKVEDMIAQNMEPIEWMCPKICPILGVPMERGFMLDSCTEPVSETYMNTVLEKVNDILDDVDASMDEHSDHNHEQLQSAINMLRNPFTNMPIQCLFYVKCV
jgi:hypothetical protein